MLSDIGVLGQKLSTSHSLGNKSLRVLLIYAVFIILETFQKCPPPPTSFARNVNVAPHHDSSVT